MRDRDGDELCLSVSVPAAGEEHFSEYEEDTAESEEDTTESSVPSEWSPEFHVFVNGPQGELLAQISETGFDYPALEFLRQARVRRFVSVVYLHLDANEMVRTSVPQGEAPRMRYDGSGLASTLAWLKGAAEDELADITSDLARIVPGIKRIRTLRASIRQSRQEKLNIDDQVIWRPVKETALGDRFEIEFDEGHSVPADLLSEGTVLALGLLTKLREPKRPRLVLLDDVDRGLHIEAQAKLIQVLRDLLKLYPDLQVVCTTHSPYLLDLFEPDEVRVLALDENRRTRALPLTAHPDFDKWKFGTQTGELWAALGHAWVVAPPEPKQ